MSTCLTLKFRRLNSKETFYEIIFLIGLQAIAKLIFTQSYYISALKIHFNMYTIPGLLMVLLSLINLLFVHIWFDDSLASAKKTVKRKKETGSYGNLCDFFVLIVLDNGKALYLIFQSQLLIDPFCQHFKKIIFLDY